MNVVRFPLIAAMTVCVLNPIAAAAAPACLTAAEAQTLIRVALPEVIGALTDKCKASLSGTAFILQSGAALKARYQMTADAAWPSVKPVVAKVAGDQAAFLTSMPDEAVRPLFSAIVAGQIGKGVKTEQCSKIDSLMASIAPLPAENMADMVVAIFGLSAKDGKDSDLNLCPTPASIPAPVSRPIGSSASK